MVRRGMTVRVEGVYVHMGVRLLDCTLEFAVVVSWRSIVSGL